MWQTVSPSVGTHHVCQPWPRGEKEPPGLNSFQTRAISWPLVTFIGKGTCGHVQKSD